MLLAVPKDISHEKASIMWNAHANEKSNSSTCQEERVISTFLSYIHCPDTIEQYSEGFETLSVHLKSNKKLQPQEIQEIIKYRLFFWRKIRKDLSMKDIILCDRSNYKETSLLCKQYGVSVNIDTFSETDVYDVYLEEVNRNLMSYGDVKIVSIHGPYRDLCLGSKDKLIQSATMARFEYASK